MPNNQTVTNNQDKSQPKRLVKSESDQMLFGVAGGLAKYLNMDPALVRVAFVVVCFATFGLAFLAYLALAAVMPSPERADERALPTPQEEPASEETQTSVADRSESEPRTADNQNDARRRRNVVGLGLVIVGAFVLMANFNFLFGVNWGLFWALVLIAAGAALLTGRWRGLWK